MQIAIDGPSGAGKSSLARELARRLGVRYVDTGAMYRALAYEGLKVGVALGDEEGLRRLLAGMELQLRWDEKGAQHVYIHGADCSEAIRGEEVSQAASRIAGHGKVRGDLVAAQQALARRENIVMDGRDIGSVVLPQADIKFYVTADVHTRAQRRMAQLQRKDPEGRFDLETVARELQARDEADSQREVTPLVRLPEAVLIDTSHDSLAKSVEHMLAAMEERGVISLS